MKRISTLILVLTALLALPLFANAEEVTFDFENNNGNWPVGEGVNFADGNLTAPLVMGEVTLTGVQGDATQPVRIMRANDGISALYVYKNGSIKLNAADGRALTKVVVTMKTGSFDLTPSTGNVAADVWTGNATEVTFSHAASGNRQILKLVITTDAENEQTVKPAADAFDVEVANIAEFNTVEDGKVVKLELNNAQVNAFNSMSSCYYVEDATGATVFKSVTLTPGDKLNGYIIGTKSTDNSIDYINEPSVAVEYALTATDAEATTFIAEADVLHSTAMTIAEACTQSSYAKLVTLSNVTITGGGQNKTLTDAEGNTMKARDYLGVLSADYVWPATAAEITGVVIYYMTGWFLMPISEDAIDETLATAALFDFANNNLNLPIGSNGEHSEDGNLGGKTLTQGDVTLSFVNSPTMPTRYYNTNRGNHFQMIKGGQLRITAAEGQAITAIRCTANVTTNPSTGAMTTNVNWATDKGEGTLSADKLNWTGNATSVRFTATGATYLDAIEVETAAANAETVTSAPDTYTDVATIAEFNALPDGTLARLTLSDVTVSATALGPSRWAIYVQDATAGAHMYCMPFVLEENNVLNGVLYAMKSNQTAGPRMAMTELTTIESGVTLTTDGVIEPISGTIAQVNVAENLNRVVKVQSVLFEGTAAGAATLTDAEGNTITVNNPSTGMSPYVITDSFEGVNYADATVIGILYGTTKGNCIYPLAITDQTSVGISSTNAAIGSLTIYNLQGMRLQQLTRGINIVNGKKIFVR